MKFTFILPALLLLFTFRAGAQDLQTPFEKDNNHTATWQEMISFYQQLAQQAPTKVKLVEYKDGADGGHPLHLVIITGGGMFHPAQVRAGDKRVVLINNGIHAGEPDGIDASMILARELVTNPAYASVLEHEAILIIPCLNVGGMLNRSCCSRSNQNGPDEYGFRGNARLLNLNRDFCKFDSKEMLTFAKIFQEWQPDAFIDTHTSDGADYQAVMTYIPTQKDKLDPAISEYMSTVLNPEIEKHLLGKGFLSCPYVQSFDWSLPPDSGLVGFMDSPRYSTGYASLFNTISYTSEAHMLKPFKERVGATFHFCLSVILTINRDRVQIARMRKAALTAATEQQEFVLRWKLNKERSVPLKFKGYTASYEHSSVTGLKQLRYDREAPFEKELPYYNHYIPDVKIKKPVAYIIPRAWSDIAELLKLNGVEVKRVKEEADIDVEYYYIDSYQTRTSPAEGHYAHYDVKVRTQNAKMTVQAGDYAVFVNQSSNRFIVEMLEPASDDSWFCWNFFDEILDRKEYFSPYIFEKTAVKLLEEHPDWKAELDKKKAEDEKFAQSEYAQLDFIYKKSQYFEPTLNRYPVARMVTNGKLSFEK